MDDKWFKLQQRRVGVTAAEIAAHIGRDRSSVSKILNGHQPMSLQWAQAFADVLQVDLDEVLRRAGTLTPQEAQPLAPGFADADAAPYVVTPRQEAEFQEIRQTFGADCPGVDVWQVKSPAMSLEGIRPGDFLLVDTNQSEICRAGDVVVAQCYDHSVGTATTLIRRYEPPALVAASPDPDDRRLHIVDGNNVAIRGKVVACWRRY